MFRVFMLVSGLGCLAILALLVAASRSFGLAGVAGVAIAGLVVLPLAAINLGPRLMARGVIWFVQAKGKPLRGAHVRIHAIRRAVAPPSADRDAATPADPDAATPADRDAAMPADPDDAAAEPRMWYTVELTIRPAAPGRNARRWHPGLLLLVSAGEPPHDPFEDDEEGHVDRALVWRGGRWQPVTEPLEVGEQRLRLLVGLRPSAPLALRFRYCLEIFGHLDLALAQPAPAT